MRKARGHLVCGIGHAGREDTREQNGAQEPSEGAHAAAYGEVCSVGKMRAAAAMVASMSAFEWAADTKPASKADGAR